MSFAQLENRTSTHSATADADLLQRLRIALSVRRRAGWHHVRVSAQNGRVELNGTVPTFYDRQLIAALVRHVAGVMAINDKLTVGDPSLRHQVTESEDDLTSRASARDEWAGPNRFAHLPSLRPSLDYAFASLSAAETA